jgi:radical SAM protein with 4Fe4S-binding SPASM domain
MKSLGVDIMSVSLDGASPKTHDKLRGIPGTWTKTMEALQAAKQAGLKAQVNTTVMRSNINELPDLFHLAKENGTVAWEVFFLIRTGRGASLESLEATECEEVMHFLFDAAHYGVPVRTAEGPHFRRVRAQRMRGGKASDGLIYRTLTERLHALEGEPISPPSLKMTPTRDGKGLLFVSHDGEVYPSGFLPICTGKVPDETLRSIYRLNPTFLALRNPASLKGRCGRCEYREICGGSRSRAFAEFGDAFQEDPACPYEPSIASPELTISEGVSLS